MKNAALLILLSLLAMYSQAQSLSEADLMGKWKVKKLKLLSTGLSKQEIKKAESLRKSFLKASFDFKADKHFSFNFDALGMGIQNAHWKYSEADQTATIQEWKDRNASRSILMEIFIKQEGDNILFMLSETPFVLQVEK